MARGPEGKKSEEEEEEEERSGKKEGKKIRTKLKREASSFFFLPDSERIGKQSSEPENTHTEAARRKLFSERSSKNYFG